MDASELTGSSRRPPLLGVILVGVSIVVLAAGLWIALQSDALPLLMSATLPAIGLVLATYLAVRAILRLRTGRRDGS